MFKLRQPAELEDKPGRSRMKLPSGISWMNPPEPSLDAVWAGEMQYLVMHPTEILRMGFKWFFLGLLVFTTVAQILLPFDLTSPGSFAVKLFAAEMAWGAALVYITATPVWPRSRLGKVYLVMLASSSVLMLLVLPSNVEPLQQLLALLALIWVGYRDEESILARFARWLKRAILRLNHDDEPGSAGGQILSLVAKILKIVVALVAFTVVVLMSDWSNWLPRLALLGLLFTLETTFLGSGHFVTHPEATSSQSEHTGTLPGATSYPSGEGVEAPAAYSTKLLLILFSLGLGGLVGVPDESWPMPVFAAKLGLLTITGAWTWARWSFLRYKATYRYYAYDRWGWQLVDLTRGLVPKVQKFTWKDVADTTFEPTNFLTYHLRLLCGGIKVDTKGSEENIHDYNLAKAEDASWVAQDFVSLTQRADEGTEASVRRDRIVKSFLAGMSVAQIRLLYTGAYHEADIVYLIAHKLIKEEEEQPSTSSS